MKIKSNSFILQIINLLSLIFYITPNLVAAPLINPNIPPKSVTVTSAFDHARTGFILRDIHTTLRCEQCHVGEIFKGTPKECAGCHSQGSRVAATPKPVNHVITNKPCDTCHTSPTSFLVSNFKHLGITDNCASCHKGQSLGVVSKPVTHIPTLLPCETCHTNTSTFAINRMDHTGITTGCTTCHLGQFPDVVSKPANHVTIPTGAGCETCHNTITFLGAGYFHDPLVVASKCNTCHGPMPGAVSKPNGHLITNAQCDTCHTQLNTSNFTTFTGTTFDHVANAATVTNQCITCHSGSVTNAYSKANYANHISTTAQCDTCHTSATTVKYTTWSGAYFDHTTVASGVAGKCSTCHDGTKAKGQSSGHINTNGAQCDSSGCHTATSTSNYTTFLGANFDHVANASIANGKCSNCHNGSAATGQPTAHVTKGVQCDSSGCHTSSSTANYSTFLGATYNHSVNLASVTGKCSNCHGGSYPGVVAKPSNHLVTAAQCDNCHTPTNTSNYTTFLGASAVNHGSYSTATTCATGSCHGSTNAVGLSAGHIPLTGAGATGACGNCHKIYNGTSVTSFYPAAMDHTVITTARCDSCHTSAYASQGVAGGAQPMVSNHIPITITGTLDCTTCHNITKTTSSGSMSWLTERMNHNSAQGGGAPVYCVTCHLTGVTYLGNMQKKNHNGSSTAKDCSSSSCHKPKGNTGSTYSSWN